MNTSEIKKDAIKGNEEFVAFLHQHAKQAKIPSSCDKAWLASVWQRNKVVFMFHFAVQKGESGSTPPTDEFLRQAAEAYQG
ncbi:MAG: hypothetical protein WC724_01765 [Candidatus Paceibacterota bacterium]|jgi:hypothetical protein